MMKRLITPTNTWMLREVILLRTSSSPCTLLSVSA
jgi:hypothetical protein